MKFSQPNADVWTHAEAASPQAGLARTTHLCVAAHQDDIEIMAYAAIAECFGRDDRWFSGVVVTDGAGSPREGAFATVTNGDMQNRRRLEQRQAAAIGEYSVCIQLAHPSSTVKDARATAVRDDLAAIFRGCRPEVIYVHNPADKHDTHVATLLRTIDALRTLAPDQRPRRVIGCEVWRDLDWLLDDDKIAMDSSARPNLAAALLGVFDSQISGGKRYDLAAVGRRLAHATFHTPKATDQADGLIWGLDLTPLLTRPELSVEQLILEAVDRFRSDVQSRVRRWQ